MFCRYTIFKDHVSLADCILSHVSRIRAVTLASFVFSLQVCVLSQVRSAQRELCVHVSEFNLLISGGIIAVFPPVCNQNKIFFKTTTYHQKLIKIFSLHGSRPELLVFVQELQNIVRFRLQASDGVRNEVTQLFKGYKFNVFGGGKNGIDVMILM